MSNSDSLAAVGADTGKRKVTGAYGSGIRAWKDLAKKERFRFVRGNSRAPLLWLLVIGILIAALWSRLISELLREKKKIEGEAVKDVALLSKSHAEKLKQIGKNLYQIVITPMEVCFF